MTRAGIALDRLKNLPHPEKDTIVRLVWRNPQAVGSLINLTHSRLSALSRHPG